MRFSVYREDASGYFNFCQLNDRGKVVVRLDGVEQFRVTIADDENGVIERHVLDHEGKSQVDPAHGDRVWTETVKGRVEISVIERSQ